MRALIAGATGFVGRRLASTLGESGVEVRGIVRDRDRADALEREGVELHEGDVLDADSLAGAGREVDMAYYLVHSMGRGSDGNFAERERSAARNFARMATAEGVGRVAYLGGLGGDEADSEHLRSRHETGEILRDEGPPLTYFRAAMVIGAESESYKMLRYLVKRLPAMVAPSWLQTPTQPIGIDDVVAYLERAPEVEGSTGREVEIGGPDVVSYADMLDRMALALDVRPRPKLHVPLLSPGLSSLWIGLVTPVDAGVARPLVEGLRTPTVVEDQSGSALFDVEPTPLDETLRRAVADERELATA
jgi:uncharacterized protein YbjT (DUF2867 family)